jgi:tetratricopeptide (TPR) repeat protein
MKSTFVLFLVLGCWVVLFGSPTISCADAVPAADSVDALNSVAQEKFERVESGNPEAMRWTQKSSESVMRGQWAEAIRCASVAISLDPGLPAPYINRAWAYTEKGLHEKAIEDSSTALRIDPRQVQALNNRGLAYVRMGQTEKGSQDYRKACEIGFILSCENFKELIGYLPSEEIQALLKFSELSFSQKDYDRVVMLSSKVIELQPNNAEAYSNLCGAKATQGDFAQAKIYCQKAIRCNPDFSVAYNNLGYALEREGKRGEAEIQYEMSCGLGYSLGCENFKEITSGKK